MKDRTLSSVFYFVRFYEWTRKADKENNLNGCFPAVARQGESNLGSQKKRTPYGVRFFCF